MELLQGQNVDESQKDEGKKLVARERPETGSIPEWKPGTTEIVGGGLQLVGDGGSLP